MGSHLLLLREAPPQPVEEPEDDWVIVESPSAAADPCVDLVMVHFKFGVENQRAVLHVLDFKLTPEAQAAGLGVSVMQIMEILARKHGMTGMLLSQSLNELPKELVLSPNQDGLCKKELRCMAESCASSLQSASFRRRMFVVRLTAVPACCERFRFRQGGACQ